jgi:RimJ/RimL family protein N-acetyltransferase
MPFVSLSTPRLLLRQWRPEDRVPFAAMNADPLVMEFFPAIVTQVESDAMADRIEKSIETRGFGLWAVEIPGAAPFAGFIGLTVPTYEAHFTPCVEIGWRLSRDFWNQGYATEGAKAAMSYGFTTLGLKEIVAMTVPANRRSCRVMEKLGMSRDAADDFDHPRVPEGHQWRRHLLYRANHAS